MTIAKAKKTILENGLLKPNDTVILGVSGGPDSIFLAHLFLELQKEYSLEISVCHVNYHLRGADSDRDEKIVSDFCANAGWPCLIKQAPKFTNSNLEDRLRRYRHDFFQTTLQATGADKIALAHTKDDRVETFLMFLLRGAGLRGLASMSYRNNHIIRPLLDLAKPEIVDYLTNHNITFGLDKTNEDPSFTRNKIRHQLLPLLRKDFASNIDNIISRTATLLQDDYSFIAASAERQATTLTTKAEAARLEIDLPHWQQLPPAMQRETLRIFIRQMKGDLQDVSLVHLQEISELLKHSENKKYKVFWELKITKENGKIVITNNK